MVLLPVGDVRGEKYVGTQLRGTKVFVVGRNGQILHLHGVVFAVAGNGVGNVHGEAYGGRLCYCGNRNGLGSIPLFLHRYPGRSSCKVVTVANYDHLVQCLNIFFQSDIDFFTVDRYLLRTIPNGGKDERLRILRQGQLIIAVYVGHRSYGGGFHDHVRSGDYFTRYAGHLPPYLTARVVRTAHREPVYGRLVEVNVPRVEYGLRAILLRVGIRKGKSHVVPVFAGTLVNVGLVQ